MTNNAAAVVLDGADSTFNALGNLSANSGTITLLNGAGLATAMLSTDTVTDPHGLIASPLLNSGTIEIGAGSVFTVTDDYTQTASGSLLIHIGGQPGGGQFGMLAVTGTAFLGGTLGISLDNNFIPVTGDAYSIITYGGHSGNFPTTQNVFPLFSPTIGASSEVLTVVNSANVPNLGASNVTAQSAVVSGQNLTVNYTVTNSSDVDATGSWTDSIYLSPGTTFDPATAILFQRVTHSGLAANSSYNGSVTAPAPGVLPGNYSIIVITDSREQVPDPERGDNTAASAQPVAVTPPVLTLGTPVSGTIDNGQSQVYEIDLQGNSQVKIDLTTAHAAGAEIYLSYNAIPSTTVFDQMAFNTTGAQSELVLTGSQPGPYFILVRGREGSTGGQAFTLEAQQSAFGITSISPSTGANQVTITIHGSQFSPGAVVSLVPSAGGDPIPASSFYFKDNTAIAATFDLAAVAAGTVFDVKVEDQSLTTSALAAFTAGTVVTGATAPVLVTITAPRFIRANFDFGIQVNFVNVSGQDAEAPVLTVSATNALLRVLGEAKFGASTVAFIGLNTGGGPAGILPAGYQGSVTVEVQPTTNVAHQFINYSYSVADPSLPFDFSAVEPYIRAENTFTDDQWAPIAADLQQRLGPTQANYLAAISRDASVMPASMFSSLSPITPLRLEMDQAQADVTTSLRGNIASTSTGLILGGLFIHATNTDTGDTFGAVILNDGSFVLPNITAGDYVFKIDGAIADPLAPVAVADGQHVTGVALTASKGTTLTGKVANAEDGSVLGGASIAAIGSDGTLYHTVSDPATGTYQLGGLPVDTYTIVISAAGRARVVQDNVAIDAGGLLRNFNIAPEATITGTLVLGPGGPTGGTAIVSAEPEGNTDPHLVFIGTANSDGTFSIPNLPGGTYDLTVTRDGYAITQLLAVTVASGGTIGTAAINLAATAASVSGTVTSTDPDLPANGLNVGAFSGGTLIGSATADQDGHFTIGGLPAGSYLIEALGNAYFSNEFPVTLTDGQAFSGANLTLQPGGVISGTLTDPGTNQPLANVTVRALDDSGNADFAITDATGHYLFQHLALGNYHVFSALGGVSSGANVMVTNLDATPVVANITAAVGAQITGRLFLSDGVTPASGGEVALYQNGVSLGESTADANGTYTFFLQKGGTFDLLASATNASFTPVLGITATTGNTFTQNFVAGTGSLAVHVTDGAQSVDGSLVFVFQTSTNAQVGFATTDQTGVVSFSNLAAGDYRVLVEADGNRGGQSTATVSQRQPDKCHGRTDRAGHRHRPGVFFRSGPFRGRDCHALFENRSERHFRRAHWHQRLLSIR